MSFRITLTIAVITSILFSCWFAFIYTLERWPSSDPISNILMGAFISWAIWAIIGCIVGLWNTGD